MRWVIASDDLVSNIGVSCLIMGIILLLFSFNYSEFKMPALILLVAGGALYYVRNKDEVQH